MVSFAVVWVMALAVSVTGGGTSAAETSSRPVLPGATSAQLEPDEAKSRTMAVSPIDQPLFDGFSV